jgi:long-chain acyl-CoA synthetase
MPDSLLNRLAIGQPPDWRPAFLDYRCSPPLGISYGEFRADVRAHAATRLPTGSFVSCRTETSAGFAARALGLLDAGACVVPLDPSSLHAYGLHEEAPGHPLLAPATGLPARSGGPHYARPTSGSTGLARLALVSGDAIADRIQRAQRVLQVTRQDVILWTMPMADHFLVSILLFLSQGATILLAPDAAALARIAVSEWDRISLLYGDPSRLGAILKALPPDARLPRLRLAITTASPAPEKFLSSFHARLGHYPRPAWGLIEAGLVSLNDDPRGHPRSVGRLTEGYQLRLGPLEGMAAGPGEGEILLRGPGFFSGYWSQQGWQPIQWQDDGWRTGDAGRVDAEGWITLRGRVDHVVPLHDRLLFAQEVERALREHPAIRDARVILHPQAFGHVEYIPEPGTPPDPASLQAHLNQLLAIDTAGLVLSPVPSIPKTHTGKNDRYAPTVSV